MSDSIVAHFDGEFFVPDEPVLNLRPGDRVRVLVNNESLGDVPTDSSFSSDPLLGLIDLAVDTGIPDLAENADHYLYGHPKQAE